MLRKGKKFYNNSGKNELEENDRKVPHQLYFIRCFDDLSNAVLSIDKIDNTINFNSLRWTMTSGDKYQLPSRVTEE